VVHKIFADTSVEEMSKTGASVRTHAD